MDLNSLMILPRISNSEFFSLSKLRLWINQRRLSMITSKRRWTQSQSSKATKSEPALTSRRQSFLSEVYLRSTTNLTWIWKNRSNMKITMELPLLRWVVTAWNIALSIVDQACRQDLRLSRKVVGSTNDKTMSPRTTLNSEWAPKSLRIKGLTRKKLVHIVLVSTVTKESTPCPTTFISRSRLQNKAFLAKK